MKILKKKPLIPEIKTIDLMIILGEIYALKILLCCWQSLDGSCDCGRVVWGHGVVLVGLDSLGVLVHGPIPLLLLEA